MPVPSQVVKFNDASVDDAAEGGAPPLILAGHVKHDTFFSIEEVVWLGRAIAALGWQPRA